MKKLILSSIVLVLLILGWFTKNEQAQTNNTTLSKVEYNYKKSLELPSYIEDATILEKQGFTIVSQRNIKMLTG
jgi:hypothetical protein